MRTTLVTINGKTYRKAILTDDQFCECNVSACTLCMFNNSNGCNATSEYDCTNGWFIEEENQPPTKELIEKVIVMHFRNFCDTIESDAEWIIKHWNDEEEVKKEKY